MGKIEGSSWGSDVISDVGSPSSYKVHDYTKVNNCSSRDIFCGLIFSILTVFSILLSIYFLNWGDPERLTRGWDFRGEICGVNDLEDLPYTYFLDPETSIHMRICMAGCPAITNENFVCFYDTEAQEMTESTCYISYSAKPYYNRYCIPSEEDKREEVMDLLDKEMIRLAWWAGDVGRTWDVLGVGALISLGVVFVIFCWISIGTFIKSLAAVATFALVGFTVILGYLSYKEGFRLQNDLCDDYDPIEMLDCDYDAATKAHIVLSSLIYLFGLIIGLVYLTHLKDIARGSVMVRHSWRPLAKDWTLLLVPIVLTVLSSGISILCLYSTVYGLSIADIHTVNVDSVPGGQLKTLDFDRYEKILLVYMIVNYIWVINFLSQISYYVAAFAQIQWYLNPHHRSSYLLYALKHAISRMGSISLGSFLIPLVQFIKVLLPCYFLSSRNCLRSITHSSYTLQILTGFNFFKSGAIARDLLDSAESVDKKAILGARLLHWITSMLVIIIAPLYVAYWLHFQDKTPTGFEDTSKVTSISVMCATVLFPAWSIARIWYMFFHGLSNSAVLVNLYDPRHRKVLAESEFRSNKVSSSFIGELAKPDEEPLSNRKDSNYNQNVLMTDGNNVLTFIRPEKLEDSMIGSDEIKQYPSLDGVIGSVSHSGNESEYQEHQNHMTDHVVIFQGQEDANFMNQLSPQPISSAIPSTYYRSSNEGPVDSINYQIAASSQEVKASILHKKKESSVDLVQSDFIHLDTNHLKDLDQGEIALKSQESALVGMQDGYPANVDFVYRNNLLISSDLEEIERAEDSINSKEGVDLIDLERNYSHS